LGFGFWDWEKTSEFGLLFLACVLCSSADLKSRLQIANLKFQMTKTRVVARVRDSLRSGREFREARNNLSQRRSLPSIQGHGRAEKFWSGQKRVTG
jgi:hypothetical protein